ncbi:MAG: DUF11 domain-containing protein [Clostridia bacterium]|nr:DUF11 domain-containing protein [Clostridia bacterium]
MFMRKGAALLLALCMMLFPIAAHLQTAEAAGTLSIEDLTAAPGSLPASGGTITLTGTLKNSTDADIDSVMLEFGEAKLEIYETIPAGGSKPFSMPGVKISAGEVDRDLALSITWPEGANTAAFYIAKSKNAAELAFTRTMDNRVVQKGSEVTLTYTVKNEGAETLTGLTVTDPCITGAVMTNVSLAPGESKQVSKKIVVVQDVASVPKAVFTAGGKTQTKTLEANTIAIGTPKLTVTATADKTAANEGDFVTFTIVVSNESAVGVTGIEIRDELGTVIRSDANIAATTGSTVKTLTVTHQTAVQASRAAVFYVNYRSEGELVAAESAPISIVVTPAVQSSPLKLTVSASPVTVSEYPAQVTFTITVQNIGASPLSNVQITEPTLGQVGSLPTLAANGKQTMSKIVTVEQARAYQFTASALDPLGTAVMNASVSVNMGSATGTPDVIEKQESDSLSTLFVVMIVIVVLIVLAGVVLVILMIQEKRARRSRRGRSGRSSDFEPSRRKR